MELNHNHQPKYNHHELFHALMKGLDINHAQLSDPTPELDRQVALDGIDITELVEDNSAIFGTDQWMFDYGDPINLLYRLSEKCHTEEQRERLANEWIEWDKRGLLPVLVWIERFVEHSKSVQVPIGVGRGSSVASYVLFLIGLHKIDPLKYGLNIGDYFKE